MNAAMLIIGMNCEIIIRTLKKFCPLFRRLWYMLFRETRMCRVPNTEKATHVQKTNVLKLWMLFIMMWSI